MSAEVHTHIYIDIFMIVHLVSVLPSPCVALLCVRMISVVSACGLIALCVSDEIIFVYWGTFDMVRAP